jgi:hypothetical protein
VSDNNSHTIRKVVAATGAVTTIVGNPNSVGVATGALPASLKSPAGLTVLPTGEVGVVDNGEGVVLIVHP